MLCVATAILKCKYGSSDKFIKCNDIENIKHILFDCMHVQYEWKSWVYHEALMFNGNMYSSFFYFEQSTSMFLNNVISFLAFIILIQNVL